MTRLLFLCVCLGFFPALLAQTPDAWLPLHPSQAGVTFAQQRMVSNDQEVILLRIVNTNDYAVMVHWEDERYYDGQCPTCGSAEAQHSRLLPPQSERTGTSDEGLRIFVRFLNRKTATLTDFRIAQVAVSIHD
ncbi:MAG: hypothetical protein ACFCUI_13570 [Bernardetiaceae bacterium]